MKDVVHLQPIEISARSTSGVWLLEFCSPSFERNDRYSHASMHVTSSSVCLIDYRVTKTKASLDLTITDHVSPDRCPARLPTLIDLISSYSSSATNITVRPEHITNLQLVRLCVSVKMGSIAKLIGIRRIAFENCTIYFTASEQQEDYDFYPSNLSRWSFNRGRTETFEHFIRVINYLGIS